MKTKITLNVVFTLVMSVMFAQNQTIVTANSVDISDQLDLRAVATLFGESRNLQEFERNINDPELMISNLDLNGDYFVDYLRVIEHRQRNTHLIIVQAVLDRDVVQDVATIEVESNRRRRRAQVQIVGNPYIYGNGYIVEPQYAYTPVIYNYFWQPTYTLWVSPWNWGHYPTFFTAWHPCDTNFYYGHVNYWAGYHNFHYVSYRRFNRAMMMYNRYHANAYANLYPNRSFISRNQNFRNAHTLANSRGSRDFRQVSTREASAIKGVERITASRGEGSRAINSREAASSPERISRENNANGRESRASSERNLTNDRNYQVGREVQSGNRETNSNSRPSMDRDVQSGRENSRPAVTNRPATFENVQRPTVETKPQDIKPVYQETKSNRSQTSQVTREQAPTSNRGNERSTTPTSNNRSSQGRSRG